MKTVSVSSGRGRSRVPGIAVLPEAVAVVAQHHEQGILHDAELVRPLDELAEPAVHHGDLGGVEGPHSEELAVGEVVILTVVVVEGFPAVVALVVQRYVLPRRVPRLVGIVPSATRKKGRWSIAAFSSVRVASENTLGAK